MDNSNTFITNHNRILTFSELMCLTNSGTFALSRRAKSSASLLYILTVVEEHVTQHCCFMWHGMMVLRDGAHVAPHYGAYTAPHYGAYTAPRYGAYTAPHYGAYTAPRYGAYTAPHYGAYT